MNPDIPVGREPRPEDPRPWYDFKVERRSAGLRLLTPRELEQAVKDLTGIAPNIAELPEPLAARGLDNQASELHRPERRRSSLAQPRRWPERRAPEYQRGPWPELLT